MNLSKIWTAAFALFFLSLASCTEEEEPQAPVVEKGSVTFFSKSDLGVGNIVISVENVVAGTITHFHSGGVTCGDGDVNVKKDEGTYSWSAVGTGKTWSGTVTIKDGECESVELTKTSTTPDPGTVTPPTVTMPSTMLVASQDYSVSELGAWWVQEFTVSTTTPFVYRFASMYQAQAAIIKPDQLDKFKNNQSFSGYGLFDNQIGTQSVTLNAGTYYVAIRNSSDSENKWSVELDLDITLPDSDKATFYDTYFTDSQSLSASSRLWQGFTIQTGFRYFLDGCSVNSDVHIIEESQLNAFKNGDTYEYLSDYYTAGGSAPGLIELELPPGNYYLVAFNEAEGSITYTMERWRVEN